jgi:hypothetical protein
MPPAVELLTDSLHYLAEVLTTRLHLCFGTESRYQTIQEVPFPARHNHPAPLPPLLEGQSLNHAEFILLLTALVPHLQADFFDRLIAQLLPQAGEFPQLGGVRGKQHRGFLPTGETALFLLAGDDLATRFHLQHLLEEDHFFAKKQILWLEEAPEGEPRLSGRLVLSDEYVDLITLGKISRPRFSAHFPAQRLETAMEWEDLVLNPQTLAQVRELEAWVKHGDTLLYHWGMSKKLKRGYRSLFYGPPGTGKTLTATLLGKYTNREVYRVDLSMVVSKFIGETEKNLATLFAKAENKGWILFFDEADALFGKRTGVRDAHDKYANQEASYLLQRVENFDGLVILASNFKNNIDEAFCRRFQSIVHFPMPKSNERLCMWGKAFPEHILLHGQVDLSEIAHKFELSGASIMNVVQYCCLTALDRNTTELTQADLITGIRREYGKEGRLLQV